MIKNIIFDVDGVLRITKDGDCPVEDVLPAALKKKYKDEYKNMTVSQFVKLCDDLGDVNKFDAGKITTEEFRSTIVNRSNLERELVDAVQNSRIKKSSFKSSPVATKLVEQLKEQKFNLYILSNTNKFLIQSWKDSFNEKMFKDMLFSCEEGLVKPDVEFYKLAMKRWKIKPQETLFVDDNPQNLVPFTRMGGHTYLYDEARSAQCSEELQNYINKINKIK